MVITRSGACTDNGAVSRVVPNRRDRAAEKRKEREKTAEEAKKKREEEQDRKQKERERRQELMAMRKKDQEQKQKLKQEEKAKRDEAKAAKAAEKNAKTARAELARKATSRIESLAQNRKKQSTKQGSQKKNKKMQQPCTSSQMESDTEESSEEESENEMMEDIVEEGSGSVQVLEDVGEREEYDDTVPEEIQESLHDAEDDDVGGGIKDDVETGKDDEMNTDAMEHEADFYLGEQHLPAGHPLPTPTSSLTGNQSETNNIEVCDIPLPPGPSPQSAAHRFDVTENGRGLIEKRNEHRVVFEIINVSLTDHHHPSVEDVQRCLQALGLPASKNDIHVLPLVWNQTYIKYPMYRVKFSAARQLSKQISDFIECQNHLHTLQKANLRSFGHDLQKHVTIVHRFTQTDNVKYSLFRAISHVLARKGVTSRHDSNVLETSDEQGVYHNARLRTVTSSLHKETFDEALKLLTHSGQRKALRLKNRLHRRRHC